MMKVCMLSSGTEIEEKERDLKVANVTRLFFITNGLNDYLNISLTPEMLPVVQLHKVQ